MFGHGNCLHLSDELTNAEIAEMLAREAERAKQPLQRALRRAARRVFLWPEEVADLLQRGVNLTQLPGIGPYLNRMILQWLEETSDPPRTSLKSARIF